jgi:hypothetical protein
MRANDGEVEHDSKKRDEVVVRGAAKLAHDVIAGCKRAGRLTRHLS